MTLDIPDGPASGQAVDCVRRFIALIDDSYPHKIRVLQDVNDEGMLVIVYGSNPTRLGGFAVSDSSEVILWFMVNGRDTLISEGTPDAAGVQLAHDQIMVHVNDLGT